MAMIGQESLVLVRKERKIMIVPNNRPSQLNPYGVLDPRKDNISNLHKPSK